MSDRRFVDTRVTKIWLTEDAILVIEFKPNLPVTKEDMEEITKIRMTTCEFNACLPVLLDISNLQMASIGVLKYGKQRDRTRFTKVLALVVNSHISRIVGNLFLHYYTPPFPIRLFSDRKQAKKWLEEYDR